MRLNILKSIYHFFTGTNSVFINLPNFMTFLHVYCGVPYFGLKKQTIKTLSFLYFIAVDLFSNWIT